MSSQPVPRHKFDRYTISVHDWEDARKFAVAAQQHPVGVIREALMFAAIVCYRRPFSRNIHARKNAKGKDATVGVRLELQDFEGDLPQRLTLSPQERELHELCGELRDQALAHSDFERNPTKLLGSGMIRSRPFSLLAVQGIDLMALVALIDKVKMACDHLIADLRFNVEPYGS